MGFWLEPAVGEPINVNVWNWGATIELLRSHRLLDDETLERARYNGRTPIEAGDTERIASFLDGFLAGLEPQDRVMLDGSITSEPDTGELFRVDLARNYSATYRWLVTFRDFCRASAGFEVT